MVEARIAVRVRPGAARSEVVGLENGVLVVRIAAPPVAGAANEALRELLAHTLGVAKSAVRVLQGQRSRRKVVAIAGLTTEAALARLS
ncbi:MAG: hypothetical protein KatS3mg131_1060 [Candidatus Tectimicrobiota bacterium]|nr:MAG: hypothetical protein KatS3mg131_1060 [Candidatus Tectomicrobia bacterium]